MPTLDDVWLQQCSKCLLEDSSLLAEVAAPNIAPRISRAVVNFLTVASIRYTLLLFLCEIRMARERERCSKQRVTGIICTRPGRVGSGRVGSGLFGPCLGQGPYRPLSPGSLYSVVARREQRSVRVLMIRKVAEWSLLPVWQGGDQNRTFIVLTRICSIQGPTRCTFLCILYSSLFLALCVSGAICTHPQEHNCRVQP
jgi:hypothetical protein